MFDYRPYIKSLTEFMVENGYTDRPFPKVILNTTHQKGLFIKTGNYDPVNRVVRVFVDSRHPKDVLRSYAHEMIHHKQNLEGRLGEDAYSGDKIIGDGKLEKLEEEAYLKGNIIFRKWTEYCKK